MNGRPVKTGHGMWLKKGAKRTWSAKRARGCLQQQHGILAFGRQLMLFWKCEPGAASAVVLLVQIPLEAGTRHGPAASPGAAASLVTQQQPEDQGKLSYGVIQRSAQGSRGFWRGWRDLVPLLKFLQGLAVLSRHVHGLTDPVQFRFGRISRQKLQCPEIWLNCRFRSQSFV